MDYERPHIIISLEEYNDLKQARQELKDKKFDALEMIMPYKQAINSVFRLIEIEKNGLRVYDAITKDGVNIQMDRIGTTENYNIHCTFIKEENEKI